jgi:hypothetical protein
MFQGIMFRIIIINVFSDEQSAIVRYIQDVLYRVKNSKKHHYVGKSDHLNGQDSIEESNHSGHKNREITIYSDCCVDGVPSGIQKDSDEIPLYERVMDIALPFRNIESTPLISIFKCFNCGRPDHEAPECKEPRDSRSFQENRELFLQAIKRTNNTNERYYDAMRIELSRESNKDKSPILRKRSQSPSSYKSDRSRRSRTPIEIVEESEKQNGTEKSPTIIKKSQQLYEQNPRFVKDVGSVDDTFLFGGELVQDPNWKRHFDNLMHKLKSHSSEKRSKRSKIENNPTNELVKLEDERNSISNMRKRKRDYSSDENDRDYRRDRNRSRSRSRSPRRKYRKSWSPDNRRRSYDRYDSYNDRYDRHDSYYRENRRKSYDRSDSYDRYEDRGNRKRYR